MRRLSILFLLLASPLPAQQISPDLYAGLHWRMIGPYRGGRTVGAAGIPSEPNVFYIGVNNGGVWKTDDAGRTWNPIFDAQPTGSIGALAVAPSDPNIVYVGSGEGLQRPDLSVGDGMYKSTDAGKPGATSACATASRSPRIIVDPHDPNRVFVAVLGHPYGPNAERGVFRSTDGGETWQKVLYKDENTGAVDLAFDPTQSAHRLRRAVAARQGPWENGACSGPDSGLFKSTDGGDTGSSSPAACPPFAQGLGRIGIGVAPSDPRRMYALVEANPSGGLYRSDDAGATWRRVNSEDRICGRGDDFAVRARRPEKSRHHLRRQHLHLPLHGRGPDLHRHQGRARRRRLSHHLDQPRESQYHPARSRPGRHHQRQRRPHLEFLVQPAHRAVLSRDHRQPVSVLGLRRPAGERIGGRRQPRQ